MRKRTLFGLGIIIVFALSLISPVIAGAPKTEAWYTFQIHPYVDIWHINTNPGGWLNGYRESDLMPILGKYEGGKAYIVLDGLDTFYTMVFLSININTKDGYMMRITEDLTIDGPTYVWLTSATETSVEGQSSTDAGGSEVAPAAWYSFRLNPWIDIVHLNTDLAPWLHGYQTPYTPSAPVLGYYSGNKFYIATDFPEPTGAFQLAFDVGTISTKDGYCIRTSDGMSYTGPTYFWLT